MESNRLINGASTMLPGTSVYYWICFIVVYLVVSWMRIYNNYDDDMYGIAYV